MPEVLSGLLMSTGKNGGANGGWGGSGEEGAGGGGEGMPLDEWLCARREEQKGWWRVYSS